MTDLADFLLARIAEDEMQAEAVGDHAWLYDGFGCKAMARPDTKLDYADRWQPFRVVAECKAKRRIVEQVRDPGWATYAVRDFVLGQLALPYADHPDYDEAWRP